MPDSLQVELQYLYESLYLLGLLLAHSAAAASLSITALSGELQGRWHSSGLASGLAGRKSGLQECAGSRGGRVRGVLPGRGVPGPRPRCPAALLFICAGDALFSARMNIARACPFAENCIILTICHSA